MKKSLQLLSVPTHISSIHHPYKSLPDFFFSNSFNSSESWLYEHCLTEATSTSHNLLFTPYPPRQNYSMTFWSAWHLPPNGCSHLLQHLSPGPVASSCVLLVPHSTYTAYGSATSHQQLVSLKIRKSQLSLFSYTHTAHTLQKPLKRKPLHCSAACSTSKYPNAMVFIRGSYGKHLH